MAIARTVIDLVELTDPERALPHGVRNRVVLATNQAGVGDGARTAVLGCSALVLDELFGMETEDTVTVELMQNYKRQQPHGWLLQISASALRLSDEKVSDMEALLRGAGETAPAPGGAAARRDRKSVV